MHAFLITTVTGFVVRLFADDYREAVKAALENGDTPAEVTQIA